MKKSKKIISFLMGVLLIFSSASVCFADSAESKDVIYKGYEFKATDTNTLSYEADEKIKEDGKIYVLTGIEYEIIKDNKVFVTKTVRTNDTNKFEKVLMYKLPSAKEIALTVKGDIKWHEITDTVTKTQEYSSKSEIPSIIKSSKKTPSGEVIDIELVQQNVVYAPRTEHFAAPAVFVAPYADTPKYSFNGEIVTITGEPEWSGYEADVKAYLGLNGNAYSITGGAWNGEISYDGEKYIRKATYTGNKTIPIYKATFVETDVTAKLYEAEVTYEGVDGKATVKAICTYEESGWNTAAKIAAGAAIVLFAGLVVYILYMIAKRRKASDE